MLKGKQILIVEDEWLLADHIGAIVAKAGGDIVGPAASVVEAMTLLARNGRLPDAATLNVRLDDQLSYPVADRLTELGVPYVFISANEMRGMPARFHTQPLLAKPFSDPQVVAALGALVA